MSVPTDPTDLPGLSPLRRISPSSYFQFMQCTLRAVWQANGKMSILPVSPAARLGSVAHRILDLAGRGRIDSESLYEAWEDAVSRVERQMCHAGEAHLIPLCNGARRYEVKKSLTLAAARRITAEFPASSISEATVGHAARSEVWLESSDGLLGGFVDRIVPGKHGVEIVDYKTGAVTDQRTGNVKEAYEVQLLLYAWLYHENDGEWPARLTVTTLAGAKHDVPMDVTQACQLVDEARCRLREIILAGSPPESLANPSPAACAFCGYRPACKKYWEKREQSPKWPTDVLGTLSSVEMLGNGTLFIVLGTGEQRVTVRGLSPGRFEFLMQAVPAAMLCNLRSDVAKASYRQTHLTTGYALEEWKP